MASGSALSYPLGAIIREAWLRSFVDRAAILRAAGLWVVASLIAHWLILALLPGEYIGPLLAVVGWTLLLVGPVGLSAVTVWRIRSLLLGAAPPALMAPINRHVIRYVLAEISLGLIAIAPVLIAFALFGPIGGVSFAVAAGGTVALVLVARLHLVPVAAALGEVELGFDRSWRMTARVWPRVALAGLACAVPLALAASQLGAWIAQAGAVFFGSAVAAAGTYGQAAVLATFLAASRLRLAGPPARLSS